MGGGRWDAVSYVTASTTRKSMSVDGTDFAYHATTSRTDRSTWKAHDSLNPLGVTMRESRDSDEHPESTPVVVLLDVTGSMAGVPRVVMDKLPTLLGLLLRKGYITDPQVLVGAIGDATCDRVPLQIGQFESDNRMDENLANFVLEGGGGGQQTESYELALYFMAKHTVHDAWEKRGQRGFLFIIGDEMAYNQVKPTEVHKVLGELIPDSISTRDILAEVQQRYDVYYIMPSGASNYRDAGIKKFWTDLLGQQVIMLDDLDALCETIAVTVGLAAQAVNLTTGLDDLREAGAAGNTLAVVDKALSGLNKTGATAGAMVPTATGTLTVPGRPTTGNAERL